MSIIQAVGSRMYWKYRFAIVVAVSALIGIAPGFVGFAAPFKQASLGVSQNNTHLRDKCSSIIIGKKLTADRSVILAHNEDLGNYSAHHYVYILQAKHAAGEIAPTLFTANVPQVSETYAYTGTKIFDIKYFPGDVTSGINEYQVAVVNNASYRRDAPDPLPKDGRIIWTEFTKFALERAKTAEEAVQVIGTLASKYKLGADSGTMFGVTDPNDAWWVEVTLDGQWVAQRVKDDDASVRANIFRIGVVDFKSADFKYSEDLVSYAQKQGWYDPKDPFDFTKVYAAPEKVDSEYNTLREKRVMELLKPSAAARSVTPVLIMSILRDHYENTSSPYPDFTYGHTQGSPHQTDERTLCRIDTEVSVVIQSRGWLPADIGAICWRAMATPCTSIYTPWYLGSLRIPQEYQTGGSQFTKSSAYWSARNLSKSVDMRYGNTVVGKLQKIRGEFERKEFDSQKTIEDKALELYRQSPGKARAYLTEYSSEMAKKAMENINRLYKYSEKN